RLQHVGKTVYYKISKNLAGWIQRQKEHAVVGLHVNQQFPCVVEHDVADGGRQHAQQGVRQQMQLRGGVGGVAVGGVDKGQHEAQQDVQRQRRRQQQRVQHQPRLDARKLGRVRVQPERFLARRQRQEAAQQRLLVPLRVRRAAECNERRNLERDKPEQQRKEDCVLAGDRHHAAARGNVRVREPAAEVHTHGGGGGEDHAVEHVWQRPERLGRWIFWCHL
ncbi:hypothetical protein BDR26DRAFT_369574, partial [Obelidium mucronatum]